MTARYTMRFYYLLCLQLVCPILAAENISGLHAGTAAIDISPTVVPFQLRSGQSIHVHDPLHVRAIALENDDGRVVIALVA